MVLVDTSVWIEYLNGVNTPRALVLDRLLDVDTIITGDLILAELLQGFRNDADFAATRKFMGAFECVTLGGYSVAVKAAENYRNLRARGLTVRKTIDTIIATRCILSGYALLHNDRDFLPFERHLGLKCVQY